MMENPFFSIIVPMYQSGKTIERCINSVRKQDFNNWELILVDDGSKDNTADKCKAFLTDTRINYIHQLNAGAAAARNTGTKRAKGTYILYLDSDDYWNSKEALDKLYQKLKNKEYQVCLYGCWDEDAKTGKRIQSRGNYSEAAFANGKRNEILYSLIRDNEFPGSCWIMAIKRAFIVNNQIYFISGHKAEDIDWILQVMTKAKKITCIKDSFYMYQKNQENSVTGIAGENSIRDILFTLNKWSKENQKISRDVYKAINTYMVRVFFTTFVIYNLLKKQQKKQCDVLYRQTKIDTINIVDPKLKVLSTVYRIFGVKITARLIQKYRNGFKRV